MKKVLWFCNVLLPEACALLGKAPQPFGGWLDNASKEFSTQEGFALSIAFPMVGIREVASFKGTKIQYYAFPYVRSRRDNQSIERIINLESPDILHVWGTEYLHSLIAIEAFNRPDKSIISVQGLLSIIEKHYYANLPNKVIHGYTFRDILRRDNISKQRAAFKKRGLYEIEAIKRVSTILGRTTWDKACSNHINRDANYYLCNETLRAGFYTAKWDIEKCERHSIFVSQGNYPIKGIHILLEAMGEIVRRFPGAHVTIAGENIVSTRSLRDKLKRSSYGKYLERLIRRNGLRDHVSFVGILGEDKMIERYLRANVFVIASSIENSPNSLGEAMMLGVPCVASCVGGVQDLLADKREGFIYPYDEPYMLSHYVCELFEKDALANGFSEKARLRALTTHDREAIMSQLLRVYNNVDARSAR